LFHECCEIMQSKADEERIRINIKIPDGLPPLEADRDKIKQVALNLLSNAIKYNRPKGSVTIKAEAPDDEMRFSVQDTGIGIPEEALSHLFEKFYRVREVENKVTGTGLGLSICKQIVQGHGGQINVKSKIGEGTTFIVCLPRASQIN